MITWEGPQHVQGWAKSSGHAAYASRMTRSPRVSCRPAAAQVGVGCGVLGTCVTGRRAGRVDRQGGGRRASWPLFALNCPRHGECTCRERGEKLCGEQKGRGPGRLGGAWLTVCLVGPPPFHRPPAPPAAGTQQYVHLSCLQKWQAQVQKRDPNDGERSSGSRLRAPRPQHTHQRASSYPTAAACP